MVDGVRAMTPAEIKELWERNAGVVSAGGPWTHLQCECILNDGAISGACLEMTLLVCFPSSTSAGLPD